MNKIVASAQLSRQKFKKNQMPQIFHKNTTMGRHTRRQNQSLKAAKISTEKRIAKNIKRGQRHAPTSQWNYGKMEQPTKRIKVDEASVRQRESPVRKGSCGTMNERFSESTGEKVLHRVERLWSAAASVREARAKTVAGKVKRMTMVTIARDHKMSTSHLY